MISLTTLCFLGATTLAAPVESVAVEVDASSIKPEGPGIARQLGGKVTSALTEQGVAVDDASPRHLRIEVRQTSFISYDVAFVLEVAGVVVRPGLENVTCEKCPLAKMDAAVVAKLPDALALLEQASKPEREPVAEGEPAEAEAGTDDGIAEPTERTEQTNGPTHDQERPKPIGPVGITGIAVGAGGLALTVAGIVKMVEPPTVEQDVQAPEFDLNDDPAPMGRALLGAGVATTILGGVLIAVDLTVLRRKRGELARMPMVVPGIGSIVIKGRF